MPSAPAGDAMAAALEGVALAGSSALACDEYCHVTTHYMTLYTKSLLIRFVLFHRKDVPRGYVATVT
jgi:hypothetical protein